MNDGDQVIMRKFPICIVHYNGIAVRDFDSMIRCALRYYASSDIHSGLYTTIAHLVKITPLGQVLIPD